MKEYTMSNMEFNGDDYFGFDTEAEFLTWAVNEFKSEANVDVTDVSEISMSFKISGQDGCCELCYSEDVNLRLSYKDASLNYQCSYAYDQKAGSPLVLSGSMWLD